MPINLPTTAQRRDNAFSHPKKISIRPATHDGYQQILHLYTSPLPTFPFLNQDNTLHQTFLNLFKSLCHQKTTQPYPCQKIAPFQIHTPLPALDQDNTLPYPFTLCHQKQPNLTLVNLLLFITLSFHPRQTLTSSSHLYTCQKSH